MTTIADFLTPQQIGRYEKEGYLVVPGLLTDEEVHGFLDHEANRDHATNYGLHGHVMDPQYRYLATHSRVAGGAAQLLGGRPGVVQTMLLA